MRLGRQKVTAALGACTADNRGLGRDPQLVFGAARDEPVE
jgi:hypothetical protein